MTAAILYRGPLERHRLALVLEGTAAVLGPLSFHWLVPQPEKLHSPRGSSRYRDFLHQNADFIWDRTEHDGRPVGGLSTVHSLRRALSRVDLLVCVGFTSIFYGRALRSSSLVWVINGLPEERLLHDRRGRQQLSVAALWAGARLGRRPDLVVVVTPGMGRIVQSRLGLTEWIAIPSSADTAVFAPKEARARNHLTYLGTGAPWQGLDLLAAVWGELAHMEAGLTFRIISQDERTRILGRHIPASRVEFRASNYPGHVARMLWEAEAGFLLRHPNLVTSTSQPLKFAEYVAAGAPVIATDIGWDLGDVIRRTGCGLLLEPGLSPGAMANRYLDFRRSGGLDRAREACHVAALEYDRTAQARRLADALRALGSPTEHPARLSDGAEDAYR